MEELKMNCKKFLSHEEYDLRILLAQMENKYIYQRVEFIGDPWELLDKAAELRKIFNQVPKPNLRINQYEGD
jgi:hypothetical protein